MSATVLTAELTVLISESKRKNIELRAAADRSLQEIKSIPYVSEQQFAADLNRRTTFVDPFIIACGSKITKCLLIGVTCLHRLATIKGIPKSRLYEVLEALKACSEAGADVQLKVLQTLPSLLQNYTSDLRAELLLKTFQVCALLQASKIQNVSSIAAATLQQLTSAVFDKLAYEDKNALSVPATIEIQDLNRPLVVRPAAFDAYQIFHDFLQVADGKVTNFVSLGFMSPELSLELIWSCLDAYPRLFGSHAELDELIQSHLLPLIRTVLNGTLPFPRTLRALRLLDLLFERFMLKNSSHVRSMLMLMLQTVDSVNTTTWKRGLVLEIIRNMFSNGTTMIDIHQMCPPEGDEKPIIHEVMASFVRLTSEKPALIGLGQQSSLPADVSAQAQQDPMTIDTVGGVVGVISASLGTNDTSVIGISSQWSIPRTEYLEQLDKSEAIPVHETYIHVLILECLNSLSDGLARIILPLTSHEVNTQSESASRLPAKPQGKPNLTRNARSQSFRRHTVPTNPLELEQSPATTRARLVADIIEICWPAILASSSTFFNATLEEQFYRALIKAYQRFVQVAGLLRLTTPRDALLTTLSKSAVPPHLLNAAMMDHSKSPVAESPRSIISAKGILGSMDQLVGQALDREQRTSLETGRPMLANRNLLCLRALLNIAIALGPTLGPAFNVVLETLFQAEVILKVADPHQSARHAPTSKVGSALVTGQALVSEVAAVEAATSRLLESTVDYPDDAFCHVLSSFFKLLRGNSSGQTPLKSPEVSPTLSKRRIPSGLPGVNIFIELQDEKCRFAVPRLGYLAALNVKRFVLNDPAESGWNLLVSELCVIALDDHAQSHARQAATGVLCKLAMECIAEVTTNDHDETDTPDSQIEVQRRCLAVLCDLAQSLSTKLVEPGFGRTDLHQHVLDSLKMLLERKGESLSSGWDLVLQALNTCFILPTTVGNGAADDESQAVFMPRVSLVSLAIGNTAFAIVQLLCSDFLASLPPSTLPQLIRFLQRILAQEDDLNMSLTSISILWHISDSLVNSTEPQALDGQCEAIMKSGKKESNFADSTESSPAACLLLLLTQLRDAVCCGQHEVRKAAFQTICRVIQNHGQGFRDMVWQYMFDQILLVVGMQDVSRYAKGDDEAEDGHFADKDTSRIIINGIAQSLAQHLATSEDAVSLSTTWDLTLKILSAYLSTQCMHSYEAAYAALCVIVSQDRSDSETSIQLAIKAISVWLKHLPREMISQGTRQNNEKALKAYIDAAAAIHRVVHDKMDTSQAVGMTRNLFLCIQRADGPKHGADTNTMSELQRSTLRLLQEIQEKNSQVTMGLFDIVAEIMTLHHVYTSPDTSRQRPTFVAIARQAITWGQKLMEKHIGNDAIGESDAFIKVLRAHEVLVGAKYAVKAECNGEPLWQASALTVLQLVQRIVQMTEQPTFNAGARAAIWAIIASICGSLYNANGIEATTRHANLLFEDQIKDIDILNGLQEAVVPRLGALDITDNLRIQYCGDLFTASIIHGRLSLLQELRIPPLLNQLDEIVASKVVRKPYVERERMCYECWTQLISICSTAEQSPERLRLAQAAAPFLFKRLALPLQIYIADQPLRGRRPQALSELQELKFCINQIKSLRLDPAVSSGDHAGQRYLYPLVVKASAIARDRWSGSDEIFDRLQDLLRSFKYAF